MSKKITAQLVAEAICRTSKRAGQAYDVDEPQTVAERAANLLREVGPYGAYIVDGDPGEWCEGALCTIYMECKGGPGDCMLPLEYYEDGMDVSIRASELLPGHAYIEFVNAAVAVVVK